MFVYNKSKNYQEYCKIFYLIIFYILYFQALNFEITLVLYVLLD